MRASLSELIQKYCVTDELMSDVTCSKGSVQIDTMDLSLSNFDGNLGHHSIALLGVGLICTYAFT